MLNERWYWISAAFEFAVKGIVLIKLDMEKTEQWFSSESLITGCFRIKTFSIDRTSTTYAHISASPPSSTPNLQDYPDLPPVHIEGIHQALALVVNHLNRWQGSEVMSHIYSLTSHCFMRKVERAGVGSSARCYITHPTHFSLPSEFTHSSNQTLLSNGCICQEFRTGHWALLPFISCGPLFFIWWTGYWVPSTETKCKSPV